MHKIAWLLLIIGGLNWLLFGVFQAELGSWLGGMDSIVWRIVYILVGLAALYELFTHKGSCKECIGMGKSTTPGAM